MSAMAAAAAWTDTEVGHSDEDPGGLPASLELLLAHLTDHGTAAFLGELGEAASSRNPDSVRRVTDRWWRTLIARHNPDYARNMALAGTLMETYASVADFRAEVERRAAR